MQPQTKNQDLITNGVNVTELVNTIGAVKDDPSLATFRFSTSNRWIDGGHNRSTVKDFYGCGQVDTSRAEAFELVADEPAVLLGNDAGPNPVEFILHGLASCMTTSMVYHAAARGIEIRKISSELEGDLDLQGFLGLSDQVRKGYSEVRVTMHVDTNASEAELRECLSFSPVYEMVSNALPVRVQIVVQ